MQYFSKVPQPQSDGNLPCPTKAEPRMMQSVLQIVTERRALAAVLAGAGASLLAIKPLATLALKSYSLKLLKGGG